MTLSRIRRFGDPYRKEVAVSDRLDQSGPGESATRPARLFFACLTTPSGAPTAEMERVLPTHKRWALEQESQGNILAAGPILDGNLEPSGSGLIVLRAESTEEATTIAQSDPMHSSGLRTFRIMPWKINEGTVRIELTLSTGVSRCG
jgi:uncharacterized protein YciI